MSRLPPTLLLQIAVALMGTAIGVSALLLSHRGSFVRPVHRTTWHLTGIAFVLMGASGLVQNAWGTIAVLAGEGSASWDAFMRAAPPLNYGRNAVELVLLGLLLFCVRRPTVRLPGATAWFALLAGVCAGAAYGLWEGSLQPARHYQGVAVMDAALFGCWALVLSAMVLADVVDRWLLLALAICAVPLPLNALWFFWLARTGVVGWMPRPLDMQLYRLAAHALVLFVVLHRRRLSRTGILVTGLGDVSG